MIAPAARGPRAHLLTMALALLVAVASLGPVRAASADPLGQVSGVISGAGTALANTWVTLTPVTDAGQPDGAPEVAITDGLGRYEFPTVAAAAVQVHVMSPLSGDFVTTYWPGVYSVAEAGIIRTSDRPGAVDIDLPRGGSVAGMVVDRRSGAPIAGALVSASLADDPSGSLLTSDVSAENGAYSISGLPPVPIDLTVRPPAGRPYLPIAGGATGDALRIDGTGVTVDKTLRLQLGAEIRGRVLDDAGEPVARASVRLVGCSPDCQPEAISDANGNYQLVGVRPGTGLRVEAVPGQGLLTRWFLSPDPEEPTTAVDVDEGDTIDGVDIVLTRAAHLMVAVTGASRTEPLRVIVWLKTSGRTYGQYFAHSPDEDPGLAGEPVRLRVGPVPPGDYAVSISPGTANPGHLPSRWVTSSADAPTGGTVQVSAGQDAQVVVQFDAPSGTPAPGTTRQAPDTAGGWPGLAQGFLAPPGADDPFG